MAERISLSFDDGVKEIEINGDPKKVIRLNPTDTRILSRIANLDEKITVLKEKYGEIDLSSFSKFENKDPKDLKLEDIKKAAETERKIESAVRELINEIFGYDVSSVVFGKESCVSFASGSPRYINFLNAISEYINAEVKKENAKSKEKIEKYTIPAEKVARSGLIAASKPIGVPASASLTDEQKSLIEYIKAHPEALT